MSSKVGGQGDRQTETPSCLGVIWGDASLLTVRSLVSHDPLVVFQGATHCGRCSVWEYQEKAGSEKCKSCYTVEAAFGLGQSDQCILHWLVLGSMLLCVVLASVVKCMCCCKKSEPTSNKTIVQLPSPNKKKKLKKQSSSNVVPLSVGKLGHKTPVLVWQRVTVIFRLPQNVLEII